MDWHRDAGEARLSWLDIRAGDYLHGGQRKMRRKIALGAYFFIGLVDLVVGWIYLTSDQFLSYHEQAVGESWQELEPGTQTLILALMKVAGGGWLSLGFLTVALVTDSLWNDRNLARWILPAGTVVFWSASFAATWSVFQKTGAPTPWAPSLAMVGVAILVFLIDAPWYSRTRDADPN